MKQREEQRVCVLETDPQTVSHEEDVSAPPTAARELRFSCTSELFDRAYDDPGPAIANLMQFEASASGSKSAAGAIGAGIGMTVVRNQESIRSFLRAVAQGLREKLLFVTKPGKVELINQRLKRVYKLERDLSLKVTYRVREMDSGVREVHVFKEAGGGSEGRAIAVVPVAGNQNVEETVKNELLRRIMKGEIPD